MKIMKGLKVGEEKETERGFGQDDPVGGANSVGGRGKGFYHEGHEDQEEEKIYLEDHEGVEGRRRQKRG